MSRLAGTSRPKFELSSECPEKLRGALDRAHAAMRQMIQFQNEEKGCPMNDAHVELLQRVVDAPFDPSATRLLDLLQRYDELNGVACAAQIAHEKAEKFREACWKELQTEAAASGGDEEANR